MSTRRSGAGRKQLQHLLEADADLQIDSTSNGRVALEWLAERNYSIILTDLRMADVNNTIWLCLLICACGAKLQLPVALRFWQKAEGKERTSPANV